MVGKAWWWEKEGCCSPLLHLVGSLTGWLLFSPLLLLQQLGVCVWHSSHPRAWIFALVFCLRFALFSHGPRYQPTECRLSLQLNANANTRLYYSGRSTFQQSESGAQNKDKIDWENNIWSLEVLSVAAATDRLALQEIQPCTMCCKNCLFYITYNNKTVVLSGITCGFTCS